MIILIIVIVGIVAGIVSGLVMDDGFGGALVTFLLTFAGLMGWLVYSVLTTKDDYLVQCEAKGGQVIQLSEPTEINGVLVEDRACLIDGGLG